MTRANLYDVAIVGGGAAGLSAAVALGRSVRRVVVIDAGEPRNASAEGAHNLLGREGTAPLTLLQAGRAEARSYGAELRPGRAVGVRREGDVFVLTLASGGELAARRLILATGLADELPDVPGLREHWGRRVLHCAYCHGWEVRGQLVGILGAGPQSIHQALLFRQLTEHVTLFRHTMPEPSDEQWEQLAALGIEVVDGAVARVDGDGDKLAVVLETGQTANVDALVVAPRFMARGELFEQLRGQLVDHPMGRFIPTGPMGATDVAGVWAAGNSSDLSAMVSSAAGAGVAAGVAVNADLIAEEAHAAVESRVATSQLSNPSPAR
ncbi:NAD(P)/FAD-dependent oxidoreductase [Sinomonas humi]|uniref:Thioredoxin reductase n=1 Tax=Sinomonas humi TaxID=1338436 RepID=A0A0B2AKS0_9MICC|nr:NAD(P)/FAD-dependent oxidoreductase [Sinomonas humi]KHL02483.1 thioredoxin reductase [Sinomonas humi]